MDGKKTQRRKGPLIDTFVRGWDLVCVGRQKGLETVATSKSSATTAALNQQPHRPSR